MPTAIKEKTATFTGFGYSPLTEKIYYGKQNPAKGMWVGDKKDVTNDFINVLFEYVGPNKSRVIRGITTGKSNLFINIPNDKEGIERAIKFLTKELETINAK